MLTTVEVLLLGRIRVLAASSDLRVTHRTQLGVSFFWFLYLMYKEPAPQKLAFVALTVITVQPECPC